MPIGICIYEDSKFSQFFPLTYLRPVYLLRAGIYPLFRRAAWYFPESDISFAARDQIGPLIAEQHHDFPLGMIQRNYEDVLFLNGRIRKFGNLAQLVAESRLTTVFHNGDETVGVIFKRESVESIPKLATPKEYLDQFQAERKDIPDFETSATLYHYPWEIMADIEAEIVRDFETVRENYRRPSRVSVHSGAYVLNQELVLLENDVEVMPGAVIDATRGPVYVGQNTRIEPHAAIYGPCYIGPNSVVLAGKVTASSIGHTCRVGGEIEESVFHAYVNKYHAGFIGHSYVGQWVNFGAMTTNSDLKNNYSNIRVSLNGESIDTGMMKVGSFIGDHTKFGIGTLLTTGINIGVCCNLFGGSLISDKEVPPFQWGNTGNYVGYEFDKAMVTARRAAERRNCTLSECEEAVLRSVYEDAQPSEGIVEF
jgi:UDP-N-acetylglucosamine diphosphorylase/glucosamine-1-phosphate N-acetyltransferase